MPPSENSEVASQEQQYHLAQSLISKGIELGAQGLDQVKPYTPTRVATLAESYGKRVHEVAESYVPRATELVNALDSRLDSHVIKPAIAMNEAASTRAEQVVTKAQQVREDVVTGVDSLRHQMGFVKGSITESCGQVPDEEGESQRTSLIELAQRKVTSARCFLENKYFKVLENADHGIEVYFQETGGDAELERKAETPAQLMTKAAKRLRPTAAKRFSQAKLRTEEELQRVVHVDLISYAADVIDKTAATTYDVAVKRPLALKSKASVAMTHGHEKLVSKVSEVKAEVDRRKTEYGELALQKKSEYGEFASGKIAEAREQVDLVTGRALERAQPLLELQKQYSDQVVEAYKQALARATDKVDYVMIIVRSTQKYVSDKAILVYNDGTKGLVLELRTEGFLPGEGKVTIAKALEVARLAPAQLRLKAEELALQLTELAKAAPVQAQEKLAELYTMMLAAKDKAVAQAPVVSAQLKEFAEAEAAKLMKLLQTAPELAQQKIEELYAWFLTLPAEAQGKLEQAYQLVQGLAADLKPQLLAAPAKIHAQLDERFPTAVAKLREAGTYYETQVSPQMMAQWKLLLLKVEQAKSYLELEKAKAALEAYYAKVKVQAEEKYATVKAQAEEKTATAREALAVATYDNAFALANAKYAEALAGLQQLSEKLKVEEKWQELKAKLEALQLREQFEAKYGLLKEKLSSLELAEKLDLEKAKALSEKAQAQALQYWTYFLELVMEKLNGYKAVFTKESVKSTDPFEDKFEKFCAENGLTEEEGSEDEFDDADDVSAAVAEYYEAMSPAKEDEE